MLDKILLAIDKILIAIKYSYLYKQGKIPELPLYLYALMAQQSYQKDAVSPLYAHSWALISEPGVHPVIYAATSNHENTHVMFVIQGTTCLADFKGDNISGYLGNAYTDYVNTAIEKVDAYLSANPNITQLSFIGHSMGARISDILGAHYFSKEEHNIRFVRMFDSPGTKDAVKEVENYNPDYPELINRIDVVSIPNFVNMAGEHLNGVLCIPGAYTPPAKPQTENSSEESAPPTEEAGGLSPAESARRQIAIALNELKFIEDIKNKHSIANIARALSEDNTTFTLKNWGTNTGVLSFAAGRGEAADTTLKLLALGVSVLTGLNAQYINVARKATHLTYMKHMGHFNSIYEQQNQISTAEPARISQTLASRLPPSLQTENIYLTVNLTVIGALMLIHILKGMQKYVEELNSNILVAIDEGEITEDLYLEISTLVPICVFLTTCYYCLKGPGRANSAHIQATPPAASDALTVIEPRIQEIDAEEASQPSSSTSNPESCSLPPRSMGL